jgi:Ca2+-transporting ATPase
VYSLFSGLLLLMMVAGVYFLSLYEGHTEGEVRAIAFSTLILGNIFLILTNLSKTRSFVAVIAEKNYAVMIILLSAFILLLLIISIPGLQQVFSFRFPGYKHFIPSVTGAIILLLILETIKYLRNR